MKYTGFGRLYKLTGYFVNLFAIVFWIALLGVAGGWLLRFTDTHTGLSQRYNVPMDSVTIEAKPKDCDFLTAPLGIKGCYYKKVIVVVRSAYGVTGVSYDGGKTWSVAGDQSEKPHVLVTWTRVED